MKDINRLTSVNTENGAKPFSFATQAQYQRYIDCLRKEGINGIAVAGGFSTDQLKCAVKAMGTCPPGYESKCGSLMKNQGYDTPIINPAPGYRPANDYHSSQDLQRTGKSFTKSKGRKLTFHRGKYITSYGNSTTAGQLEMTGFNFMPKSFKDKSKAFVDPRKYGFEAEIQPGRFVSATHQRVTGGKIVPLKEPLETFQRSVRPLQNINLPEEDWVEILRNLKNINKTTKGVLVTPPKISGVKNINGNPIQNIKQASEYIGFPLDEVVWPGPDGDEPGSGTGGGSTDDAGGGVAPGNGGGTAYNEDYAPFDTENIRYNPYPVVDITPLAIDNRGNFYGGGPTARATLTAPTPEFTINAEDALGIAPNSELIINGKKIVIRGPNLSDIKTQVNCAKAGVVAETGEGSSGPTLTIASCDSSPWTVANGCGGGTYKQVGDFHINRGFEQQKNVSRTLSDTIIPAPASAIADDHKWDDYDNLTEAIRDLSQETFKRNRMLFRRYELDDEGRYSLPRDDEGNVDVNSPLAAAVFSTPAIAPMENLTEQSTYSTGGSGYRIGDRLRLVGGTPVNNSTGPLTKICIDVAGAGYTNPANLQVIINGDGQSPGSGAVAAVTRLDELGGIAEIEMLNYGTGYDTQKLPSVEIYDRTPSNVGTSFVNVLAYYTANISNNQPISISAGQTVQIEAQRKIYNENHEWDGIEISQRFVRATAPLNMGQTREISQQLNSEANVAYVDPASQDEILPYRAEIQMDTTIDWGDYLRPNSLVEIVHFPYNLFHFKTVELDANIANGANLVISYDDELWNSILVNGGHHIGVYADTDGDGNVELIGHAGYDFMKVNTGANANIDFGAFIISDTRDTDGAPDSSWGGTVTLGSNAASSVYITVGKASKFWIPEPTENNGSIFENKFIIEDPAFKNAVAVAQVFQAHTDMKLTVTKPWWYDLVGGGSGNIRPVLVDATDPRIPKVNAELSAMVGMRPDSDYTDPNNLNDEGNLLDRSFGGPLRIAKFIVTGVDDTGGITSLRVIDRGLYSVFPSDLTYGIPLEYDYEPQGFAKIIPGNDSVDYAQRLRTLGVVDPFRQNTEYGSGHPEYVNNPFISSKHPDWHGYPEFYYDGKTYQSYTGSPGAYDPSTFVIVNTQGVGTNPTAAAAAGRLLRKQYEIETDPASINFGKYKLEDKDVNNSYIIPGGTGARLFLTSEEVPNCSEKGSAKEQLGLPDEVVEVNAPNALARAINNALTGVGYTPEDISFEVEDVGEIGVVRVQTDFPGLRIDSPTPGVLPKIGLPVGDYNLGMLCTEAVLQNPNLTDQQALEKVKELWEAGNFGVLTEEEIRELTGTPREFKNPTAVVNLLCIERLGPTSTFAPPGVQSAIPGSYAGPYPLNDNNSVFHDGKPQVYAELYKYDITDIYGKSLTLTGDQQQSTPVNVFDSKRFNESNPITTSITDLNQINNDGSISASNLPNIFTEPHAWLDNYNNKGWAYLENGVPKYREQPLVDTKMIDTALIYDPETGEKKTDLQLWDPFKGVLPGFIANEIHFVTEQDPVSYKNDKSTFGKNNVGKVWWDVSTIRYEWYEQGTAQERKDKWGKAFPGSSITVCEWVESKALPSNWTGNGVPRWQDKYVTERRQDPETGKYQLYYYYWVQNRKVVDPRVKEKLGRKLDTQTIARYIANPSAYGLDMISFVDQNSFVIHNPANHITDDDNHLQINISRNNDITGLKHTAWKLLREGDNNSVIPEHLTDKLIDSLCGENAIGQQVPDPRLSVVERYGIAFRPRQTMFQNITEARRVMVKVLNELLANIKLNTQYPQWDTYLPTNRRYVNTANWYAIQKIDPVTQMPIRYDSSYKPVSRVSSVAELYKLRDLDDGTVIQVKSSQNDTAQLWEYNAREQEFNQIVIFDETVQLSNTLFTDRVTSAISAELRPFLRALADNVFAQGENWNKFFFEMMKYAYLEQKQLSWAFKTSYLYVEKEEDDLIQIKGFKPDNFQKVLDYMNEVKPFNAKIREYKDGKRTPIDLIGQNNLSDYDKPPYVDPDSGAVRILNDFNQDDYDIMRNSAAYIDYVSVRDKTQDPIRKANTKLVFDRTNWQLTEYNWNMVTTPVNLSIAQNIANLTQQTVAQVEANVNLHATDKIFKFDPEVQSMFALEVNSYFNDNTAYANANIVGNSVQMFNIVEAGQLKNTLALVKEKVGGNFRGDTLDGKKFGTLIDYIDYVNESLTEFGWDSDPWDENTDGDSTIYTDNRNTVNYGNVTSIGIGDMPWDSTKELVSYEGIFNEFTQGNVTLRKNDENYEGFDGITFQRVLYGEERPEEMALIDPLESLILTVTTSPFARGSAEVTTVYDSLDANADIFHSVVSVDSVRILNPGIGYVNPTVVFTDAPKNSPTNVAVATATVAANGAITAISITDSGAGYESIGISLSENITVTLSATSPVYTDTLQLVSATNARVGQTVTYNNQVVGIVSSISSNTVYLDRALLQQLTSGAVLKLAGRDFQAEVETGETLTAGVRIDKEFADQQLSSSNANLTYSSIVGEPDLVEMTVSVPFSNIANVSGADPDTLHSGIPGETVIYYAIDTVAGYDSATEDGKQGSWDVAVETAEETISVKIAPEAKTVKYRSHMSLFGNTDYYRILNRTSTTLAQDFDLYDTEIHLTNSDFLPFPTSLQPGIIWIGSEKIHYARRDGNTLSLITRGVSGTTIQSHASGTAVFSAENGEMFNDLNPRGNIWLDTGRRYNNPSTWDEIEAGLDGILGTSDDIINAWDELANGNITVSTVNANVVTSSNTVSNVTLLSNMTLTVGEAVRLTHASNANITEVVSVTGIDGSNITVTASYNDTLDTNLFVNGTTVLFSSFDYGVQAAEDRWDAATVIGETARSLADRANADFSSNMSIMRFLHDL